MLAAVKSSSGVSAAVVTSSANPPSAVGSLTQVTCHDTAAAAASAWVAEAPLKSGTAMWCVDSAGNSKQETSPMGAAATACQ